MCLTAAAPSVKSMRNHVTAPATAAALCLVVLLFFVRGHAGPPAPVVIAPAAAPPPISGERPDRLDRSGDDLFWTTTGRLGSGTPVATVSRARGDVVTVVRREFGVSFGDVADGRFVVVNNFLRGSSRIERLGDGSAVAASPGLIGLRDLGTDGTSLFWADEAGIHTVPVGGGVVRTPARSPAVGVVTLDGGRLYFAAGNEVRSVGIDGGRVRTEVSGRATVTALAVRGGRVYWSELGSGIRGRGGFFPSPAPGRVVTEITTNAARVTWVDCTAAGDDCRVRAYADGVTRSISTGAGTHDMQDDGVSVAYAGAGGVSRRLLAGPGRSARF